MFKTDFNSRPASKVTYARLVAALTGEGDYDQPAADAAGYLGMKLVRWRRAADLCAGLAERGFQIDTGDLALALEELELEHRWVEDEAGISVLEYRFPG